MRNWLARSASDAFAGSVAGGACFMAPGAVQKHVDGVLFLLRGPALRLIAQASQRLVAAGQFGGHGHGDSLATQL